MTQNNSQDKMSKGGVQYPAREVASLIAVARFQFFGPGHASRIDRQPKEVFHICLGHGYYE